MDINNHNSSWMSVWIYKIEMPSVILKNRLKNAKISLNPSKNKLSKMKNPLLQVHWLIQQIKELLKES